MLVKHLSASSIKTFNMCQYSFFLSYICKMRGFNNSGALKGSVTHDSVEEIFSSDIDIRDKYTDVVKKHFYEYKKNDNDNVLVEEDLEECEKFTQKIVFDDKYNYFDAKKLGIEQKFDFVMDPSGNVIKKNVQETFKNEEDSSRETAFIHSIKNIGFRIFGFIDMIIEIDKDTIEIVDWKTSKKAMTPAEARKDPQLLIYDLVGRVLYPQYKNRIITLYYCKHQPITECFTDEDSKDTIYALVSKWIAIKMCNNPQRTISPIDANWKCAFCSFYSDPTKPFKERTAQCRNNCNIFYKLHKEGIDLDPIIQCVNEKVDLGDIYG